MSQSKYAVPEHSLNNDQLSKLNLDLECLCPLMGRDKQFINEFKCGEGHLHIKRMIVELENVICLIYYFSENNLFRFTTMPHLDKYECDGIKKIIKSIIGNLSINNALNVKFIDMYRTDHDIKAVEYHLKYIFETHENSSDLVPYLQLIHFPLTSEDVNNLAYNLLIVDAMKIYYSGLQQLYTKLGEFAVTYSNVSCLAFTHGQPATPVTLGKKFAEMQYEIYEAVKDLASIKLTGKFSGATGGNNPIEAVFKECDYEQYAKKFVEHLGFEYQYVANQRNNHIAVCKMFAAMNLINNVLDNCANHIWDMIHDGFFKQLVKTATAGSSAMPHKVNPWEDEYAFGEYQIAITMLNGVSSGLIKTRFERSLNDHPWERMYGQLIASCHVPNMYFLRGLTKLVADVDYIGKQLISHPEVMTEAVNIAMKMCQIDGYEVLKDAARSGQPIDTIIQSIPNDIVRNRVINLTPEYYIGNSVKQVEYVKRHMKLLPRLNLVGANRVYVFDFDNTLVNTKDAFQKTLRAACQVNKVDVPDDNMIFSSLKKNLQFEQIFSELFDDQTTADNILNAYRKLSSSFSYSPTPNSIHFLQSIQNNNCKVIILTNRVNDARKRLDETGFIDLDNITIVSANPAKPNQDAFFDIVIGNLSPYCFTEFICFGDSLDDYHSCNINNTDCYSITFNALTTGLTTKQEFLTSGIVNVIDELPYTI